MKSVVINEFKLQEPVYMNTNLYHDIIFGFEINGINFG